MKRDLACHLRHCVTRRLTVNDISGTVGLTEERFNRGDSEFRRESDSRWRISVFRARLMSFLNARGNCVGNST